MTVAAFVLSILAVLIAALSAYYTRLQASAATRTARLEAARRHDEMQPVVTDGEIEAMGGWDRLYFRIRECQPLARVEAEIFDTDGVQFRQGMNGVPPQMKGLALTAFYEPSFVAEDKKTITTGDALYWAVDLSEKRSEYTQLRLVLHGTNGEKWKLYRQVRNPAQPIVRYI